jgi:hypothetical protein
MYTKSRKVSSGTLVRIRGSKIIVCNDIKKAAGVYTERIERKIIRMDGERITSVIPRGIITWGPVEMKVATL